MSESEGIWTVACRDLRKVREIVWEERSWFCTTVLLCGRQPRLLFHACFCFVGEHTPDSREVIFCVPCIVACCYLRANRLSEEGVRFNFLGYICCSRMRARRIETFILLGCVYCMREQRGPCCAAAYLIAANTGSERYFF